MDSVRFHGSSSDFSVLFVDRTKESVREALRKFLWEETLRGQGGNESEPERAEAIQEYLEEFDRRRVTIAHGMELAQIDQMEIPPLMLVCQHRDATRIIWCVPASQQDVTILEVVAQFAALMESVKFSSSISSSSTSAEVAELFEQAVTNKVHFEVDEGPEMTSSGRLFGCLLGDVQRKLPHFKCDFTAGVSSKAVASIVFLFFACIAPAIAFGALLSQKTAGAIGVLEMILGTAICGIVYALASAQPLTILGSTGPVIIFLGILYDLCQDWGIPYLPTFSIVGLWTMVFLIVAVAIDACVWVKFFTRFTDDTFAALISLIFIYEAGHDILGRLGDSDVSDAEGLLSLLLALTTFYLARRFVKLRHSIYLRRFLREFCSDFGPTIAIVVATCLGYCFTTVELETLSVPDRFTTTSGRSWLVNPFEAPLWVWIVGTVPAFLVSILLFLDQNITVRLVNDSRNKLQKGGGYHLDLLVVALLVGVCSLFGLPWMVAATVRSLNHVRSLSDFELIDGKEKVLGVLENRLSGLTIHVLVASSLLVLPMLNAIPLPVLFGLFLFMGVTSMGGNQLFERINLLFADPARYAPTYYLRVVPLARVHLYTFLQLICLLTLWVVKTSIVGILFPLFIGLLIPVRFALEYLFTPLELLLLDGEVDPESEENQLD
jgi:hypothetical protein